MCPASVTSRMTEEMRCGFSAVTAGGVSFVTNPGDHVPAMRGQVLGDRLADSAARTGDEY